MIYIKKGPLIHLICWAIFIFYEVVVTGVLVGKFSPPIFYILFYVINISTFYLHAYYILPFGLKNQTSAFWRLPVALILELVIYCLIIMIASGFIEIMVKGNPSPIDTFDNQFFARTVWRGTYFMLIGTGYYFLFNYLKKEAKNLLRIIEIERLEKDLLRSEKDFLRAQINPHLLFNTLSFIKYAAKKKPEDAEEAILRLSDIISFSLDENNKDYSLLSSELKQVENMIRLNQLRYENRLHLEYQTTLEQKDIPIIPIVLLTLTENVFKHGNLLDKNFPAQVRIACDSEFVTFSSINLPSHSLEIESKKLGMKNIKTRLQNYYSGNATFSYGLKEGVYKVNLAIRLGQN